MALVYLQNSFLESADTYLADNPVWEAASSEEQDQALIDATRILDNNLWVGSAVSSTQPLGWPRTSFSFFDPVLGRYVQTEEDSIPVRLQKATAFLALHFLKYPQVINGYDVTYDEISVGPISIKNTDASSSATKVALIPTEIRTLILPLLQLGTTSTWWRAN